MTIKEKFSLSLYLRVSKDLVLTRSILKEISRISRFTTFTRNKSVQISSRLIAILNRIQSIRCYEMDTVHRISLTQRLKLHSRVRFIRSREFNNAKFIHSGRKNLIPFLTFPVFSCLEYFKVTYSCIMRPFVDSGIKKWALASGSPVICLRAGYHGNYLRRQRGTGVAERCHLFARHCFRERMKMRWRSLRETSGDRLSPSLDMQSENT